MKHYLETTKAVLQAVMGSAEGLSSVEVQDRLQANGKNKLIEPKKDTILMRFLKQITDPMIIVLLVAAVVSAVTAIYANESLADVFIILFVVILNAVLGVVQESKAEKAINALQEMSAATSKVLRDGILHTVKSEDLVVGDVILLEAGDAVPADARLLESASLKVEEAALTGESVPSEKFTDVLSPKDNSDVVLGDRNNMVYMGSSVSYGRGKAVIIATGMDTEMGKIATAINVAKDNDTPLQKKLHQLNKVLTVLVLVVCVAIFGVTLLTANAIDSVLLINTFMLAVSLAVAAIPEGLAAVVTIVLSMGVTKMSKNNAIIRQLTAVETLGCTQIICSDKTGTLTQNKMTVIDTYASDEDALAIALTLCNDADFGDDNETIGDPTETALIVYGAERVGKKATLVARLPRIGEVPFDSVRKMMTTLHKQEEGVIQYTKGAPDELLKRCTHIIRDGQMIPLDTSLRDEILAANKSFADRALRVLAAAYRQWASLPEDISSSQLEQNLVFLGLVGMMDPVRPEVKIAIEECKNAGVKVIMITGDHRDTAAAIGMELGIISSTDECITGAELDELTDEELDENIFKYGVYARVQPEHKVRIVQAWQDNKKVTAMTGDGVNDAPAIKNADIGVGMGITGTDVTKNVADMVLADDNFATIVKAVEEGRRIYDNIRKTIQFLLSSNLSEVLAIFTATLLGFTILEPAHILWINLITDSLPALALGAEKGDADIMTRPPRDTSESVFAGGIGVGIIYQGIMLAAVTLAAYFIGHYMEAGVWAATDSEDGVTMAFLTLSMAEVFHSFNMRSLRNSVFSLKGQNRLLLGAMALAMLLTAAVIFIPALSGLFGFSAISIEEYFVSMALAFSVIPIVEFAKFIRRRFAMRKNK